jgi:putative endonuclease
MFYTYILKSKKNGKLYIGSTSDLKKRFKDHNKGLGGSYTSKNRPFELIYYEAYLNKSDSLRAERFYKTGHGRDLIKEKIKTFLQDRSA